MNAPGSLRVLGWVLAAGVPGLTFGCSSGGDAPVPGLGAGGSGAGGASGAPVGGSGAVAAGAGGSFGGSADAGGVGGGAVISVSGSGGSGVGGSAGSEEVCATATAAATLEPVYLGFAFDVSGSMGKGDYPWHDATLKWDPVVAATRGFFEDPASTGIMASLTAFPIDADEDERCDPESYASPDVAMTELPSATFGAALDTIREGDWRGGTPTLAVVEAVLEELDAYRVEHPGRYALVLVTDGYPQSCDDDSIESVEEVVRAAAADIPTYVIGVKNPPLVDDDGEAAPDTVTNLGGVAEAGGTETAFIIDTGDAARTSLDFQAAIEKIRGAAVACNLQIPMPPDRRKFEKDRVVVSTTSGTTTTELTYDASCAAAGAWHYDDVDAPTEVVLCPTTCATVQSDVQAALSVGFTCQPVITFPR